MSAHPDVILKMGTKEVLHRTRTMSWGCDTALYRTAAAMRAELPARLDAGPRVIKRNRGNGGQAGAIAHVVELDTERSRRFWSEVKSLKMFQESERPLWRISTTPTRAAKLVKARGY